MNRRSFIVCLLTVALCIATQLLPLFPLGAPPPSGSKINFYGWPCLSLTTIANADAFGSISERSRHVRPVGLVLNLLTMVVFGFCCFAGVAWFLAPQFPKFSILDLLATTTSVAVLITYFTLVPSIAAPIATLSDSVSTHRYYTTDRTLLPNVINSTLIALGVYGAVLLAGRGFKANSMAANNNDVQRSTACAVSQAEGSSVRAR